MQVIFMGTPEFSVAAFKRILSSRHKIVACYTQPAKPASRGMQLKKSPVQLLAEENGIPVYTPVNFKDANDVSAFKNLKADVAVVAAYGLLLPVDILSGTKFGCINIHPSLLPRWRGAAPIHRPVMEGDAETGCCIMMMDKGLDTGDVISCKKIPLLQTATTGQMHDVLSEIGAEMVVDVLNDIEHGNITLTKQSEEGVTYAKKISKEESLIDFSSPSQHILNKIRGLNPYPAAYFEYEGKRIKIFSADKEIKTHQYKAGEIINDKFHIAAADGIIIPVEVQIEGKKRMPIDEFLKGIKQVNLNK